MLSNLLSLLNHEGSLELGEACLYALIGLIVVFAGITLIICIIWIIGLLMRKTNNLEFLGKAKKSASNWFKNVFKRKKAVTEEKVGQAEVSEELPEEIKVAIIGAIMAYYAEQQPKCEFKVKRIKRI